MKKWLVCVAITCNALCAGGVYSFPLISPALVRHMHFSQPQLTTIALAGMVGQYPFAAFVGKVLDRHGPRTCSLAASLLFALGFGMFSFEIGHAPEDTPTPSVFAFGKLIVAFGFVGLGTVMSWFAIVFSATSTFPAYTGIASGTTMALFGSSPLVIAAFASSLFTDSDLNVTHFLAFLAALCGVTHAFGAVLLPGPVEIVPDGVVGEPDGFRDETESAGRMGENDEEQDADERSPFLTQDSHPQGPTSNARDNTPKSLHSHIVPVREPQHGPVIELIRDPYFWVLILVVTILVGECEMIMANLGSLFLSLPPTLHSSPSTASLSAQVQILSLANTLSRLLVGPLADILAPSPTTLAVPHPASDADGASSSSRPHRIVWAFPRKQHLSRTWFLVCASVLLALTFGWALVRMRTQADVWVLCIGIGAVYGSVFTVLPSILSSIYGPPNLGRNFGVLSYAFFVGTSVWAYLYAAVSDAHTPHVPTPRSPVVFESPAVCMGTACWAPTFGAALGALGIAFGAAGILWRAWRERV